MRHFDLRAQARSKLLRSHEGDPKDVAEIMSRRLVSLGSLLAAFGEIEPYLYRFSSIDPPTFRGAVLGVVTRYGE